ncbi:uncharacterized protein [Bombus flavifrons]|uniref:uncharacterized protein n=1 Tax=Bombus flavifrons TaxID=103934 RepID=UPI0037041C8C
MRFFNCSQCLTGVEETSSSQISSFKTTDPLVSDKQLSRRVLRSKSKRKVTCASSGSRFVAMIRSLRASWKRNRSSRPGTRSKRGKGVTFARPVAKKVDSKSGILATNVEAGLTNGKKKDGKGNSELNGEEFEREYYEQLEALKFLIEPPACFRTDETRQNFENKLNTLDFRRMNTVAIPTGEFSQSTAALRSWGYRRMKNSVPHSNAGTLGIKKSNFKKFYSDAIDDTRSSIERSMIHLFDRAPILKNKNVEAVRGILFNTNESKTVRFKDEHDDRELLDEQELLNRNMNIEDERDNISLRKTSKEMKRCMILEGTDAVKEIVGGDSSLNDKWMEEDVCFDENFDTLFDVAVTNGMVSIDYSWEGVYLIYHIVIL